MATTYGDPLIGVDLKLDTDLNIDSNGDLMLIGQTNSADNVWQAVWFRIMTTLGSYLFADNYGTKAKQMVDDSITDSMIAKLKTQIQQTIAADARVQQVSNLSVTQDTDNTSHVIVSFGIVTINGQTSYGTQTL